MTTTLDIYPLKKSDQKYFVCQFRTSEGVAEQVFKLSVKSKFSWLYPLIAIVIEILIVSAVILVHEYRQRKKEQHRQLLLLSKPPVNQQYSHLYSGGLGAGVGGFTPNSNQSVTYNTSITTDRPNNFVLAGNNYNQFHQGETWSGGGVGPMGSMTQIRPLSGGTTALPITVGPRGTGSNRGTGANSTPTRTPLLTTAPVDHTRSKTSSSLLSPNSPSSSDAGGSSPGSFPGHLLERRPSGAVLCKASPKRVNQLQEQALIVSGGVATGGAISGPTLGSMANWYNNRNLSAYDRAYYSSQC